MPNLLKFAAVESFIANSDGTINQMHNYWYYDWSILPPTTRPGSSRACTCRGTWTPASRARTRLTP